VTYDRDAQWLVVARGVLRIAVNLSTREQVVPLDGAPGGTVLLASADCTLTNGGVRLAAESVGVLA
jgi:hypothetical protein